MELRPGNFNGMTLEEFVEDQNYSVKEIREYTDEEEAAFIESLKTSKPYWFGSN